MTAYRIEDLPPRISRRIVVNPVTGCWEWQGACDEDGYGPGHLEPVTNAENLRRAGLLITHCPANHEYTEANTYIPPEGGKQCRACKSGQPPAWVTVLLCPGCGHSRTGPAGRYCGDCRCLHANTKGRRCGNLAEIAGRCECHLEAATTPTEVGALLPPVKQSLTCGDAA